MDKKIKATTKSDDQSEWEELFEFLRQTSPRRASVTDKRAQLKPPTTTNTEEAK